MSSRKAARRLAVGAALVLMLPLVAPAQDRAARRTPRRAVGAHPAIAAQVLSAAQRARLASDIARLDRICAPLQMARDPLTAALRTMLEQREDSLNMQQQRLRKLRGQMTAQQGKVARRGTGAADAAGNDAGSESANQKERLAEIDGALATFARERTQTRKDYQALIAALQAREPPAAAGAGETGRSLAQALGALGGRISRRIGPGTYRRIARSAAMRALSCYNTHLGLVGLVSADGRQCRLQSVDGLRPQFLNARCSYDPKHP